MRYYDLSIIQPSATKPQFSISTKLKNGGNNPSPLQVNWDIPVAPYNTPVGGQAITVQGIGLFQDLSQTKQYAGGLLTLRGGMQQPGLPLANPNQAGIITVGYVFQVFANWAGTQMDLDFVVLPSPYSMDSPGQIEFSCDKGGDVVASIINTLKLAYPQYKVVSTVPSSIISIRDLDGFYHTLEQFSADIQRLTNSLSNGASQVLVTIQKGVVQIYQVGGAQPVAGAIQADRSEVHLDFKDLIGQPTWIRPNVVQVKCVTRADMQVGTTVYMPVTLQNAPGNVQILATSLPSSEKYESAFKGKFSVLELRHTGNSRGLDQDAWITTFNCGVYGQLPQ